MYDRVLIPTDGSDGVQQAIKHGLAIAEGHEATVHGLYVIDRRLVFAADDSDQQSEVRDTLRSEGNTAVQSVAEAVTDAGLAVETAVQEGIPASAILDYVSQEGIDLVVMGTHGRTGRDRLGNLGSVTNRVVRGAEVPIVVVNIGGSDRSE